MATNPNNLYEYYTSQGQSLPSVQERASLYQSSGLGGNYTGTASQNQSLLSRLLNNGGERPLVNNSQSVQPRVNTSAVDSSAATSAVEDMVYTLSSGGVLRNPFRPYEQIDQTISSAEKTITDINGDNIKLNSDERAMLDGLRATYARARASQEEQNRARVAGENVYQQRLGGEYNSEDATREVDYQVRIGFDKIKELDIEEQTKLAEARQAIRDNRLKAAKQAYDMAIDARKNKTDEIKYLNELTMDYNRLVNEDKKSNASAAKSSNRTVGSMFGGAVPQELLSISGMTESQIIRDLGSDTPPAWFAQLIATQQDDGSMLDMALDNFRNPNTNRRTDALSTGNASNFSSKQLKRAWKQFKKADGISSYVNTYSAPIGLSS